MELNEKELETLWAILRVEIAETEELIKITDDKEDKKGLEKHKKITEGIFSKVEEIKNK